MGDLRITKEGGFVVGVAYNPHYGFDFGDDLRIRTTSGEKSEQDGLHNGARADKVEQDFKMLAAHGVTAVSVNLFADGRTGITFDPGNPNHALGAQKTVFAGIDTLMTAAVHNAISVHFVLFDSLLAAEPLRLDQGQVSPERKQGHLGVLADPHERQLLLERVIRPVLEELGKPEYRRNLLSVELVNEPELIIEGLHHNPGDKIPANQLGAFKQYMRDVRDLVHSETGAQFTVGSLGLSTAGSWLDVLDPARDYLSVHFYANPANGDPGSVAGLYKAESPMVTLLQSSVPVVFGEYAGNGYETSQGATSGREFQELALVHGVKGTFAWSMYSGHGEEVARGQDQGEVPGAGRFGRLPYEDYEQFVSAHRTEIQDGPTPRALGPASPEPGGLAGQQPWKGLYTLEWRASTPSSPSGQSPSDARGAGANADALSYMRASVTLSPGTIGASPVRVYSGISRSGMPVDAPGANTQLRVTVDPHPAPGGAEYFLHLSGSTPLIPGAPRVDSQADITLQHQQGTLTVTAKFVGNAGLAGAWTLRDAAGKSVLLAADRPRDHSGASASERSDPQHIIGLLSLRLGVNQNGTFGPLISAQLQREDGQVLSSIKSALLSGDRTIEEWNQSTLRTLSPAHGTPSGHGSPPPGTAAAEPQDAKVNRSNPGLER